MCVYKYSPFGPTSGPLILDLPILDFCPNSGLFSLILDFSILDPLFHFLDLNSGLFR